MNDLIIKRVPVEHFQRIVDATEMHSKRKDRCEKYNEGFIDGVDYCISFISTLPSVQSEQHYDEWCTDCKEYDRERHCCPRWNRVIREALNDAQPEQKTGKWIYQRNYTWECSECKQNPTAGMGYVQRKEELFKYCPNCGTKMDKE